VESQRKLGMSVDEVLPEAGTLIEQKYGLYEGFEKAVKERR
jgi:translation initiation factor 2 alpha subunit (eIF-2alpha)